MKGTQTNDLFKAGKSGISGMMSIPKRVPKAKMKRIFKQIDTWMNDDVFAIQQNGFEGIDYTVKDGVKVINQE
jgi:putative aldouronate transport system substrate-binding protein